MGKENINVISTVWPPNKPEQANAVTGNISKYQSGPRFKQTVQMLRNVLLQFSVKVASKKYVAQNDKQKWSNIHYSQMNAQLESILELNIIQTS